MSNISQPDGQENSTAKVGIHQDELDKIDKGLSLLKMELVNDLGDEYVAKKVNRYVGLLEKAYDNKNVNDEIDMIFADAREDDERLCEYFASLFEFGVAKLVSEMPDDQELWAEYAEETQQKAGRFDYTSIAHVASLSLDILQDKAHPTLRRANQIYNTPEFMRPHLQKADTFYKATRYICFAEVPNDVSLEKSKSLRKSVRAHRPRLG